MLRYSARLFGFAKVGRQIDASIRYAVDLAVRQGRIMRENGRVKVVEKKNAPQIGEALNVFTTE